MRISDWSSDVCSSDLLIGTKNDLSIPDTVIIDDVGAGRMFGDVDPIGQRLELNDQRAIVRGMADAVPSFTSTAVLYTTYSQALRYVPGTRNRMSLVIAGATPGVSPGELVRRIEGQTGLRARTREQFAQDGIDFIIENTDRKSTRLNSSH